MPENRACGNTWMKNSTVRRCHYLNEENVPLSVAVCEALTAHDRAHSVPEERPLRDYLDVEVVDSLFTESVVNEEDAALSLQLTLPGVRVDVDAESTYSDDPVQIRVTETEE